MTDTIGNAVPRACILYGRSPSGVLTSVTTDGNGNLNIGGAGPVTGFIGSELYHDDFQRPDENPLDPARWQERVPGDSALVVANHLGSTSLLGQGGPNPSPEDGGDGQGMFIPILPNDQYVEVVINAMNPNFTVNAAGTGSGSGIILYARGNQANIGPCYLAQLICDFTGASSGTSTRLRYYISQLNASDSGYTYEWVDPALDTGFVVSSIPGLAFRFGVVGDYSTGHLYMELNGVRIFTGKLSDSPVFLSSGHVGMQLYTDQPASSTTNYNDISISRFATGNVIVGGAGGAVDTINNSNPIPVVLYGRAPNGQLQAVTTDGNGKLN